MTQPLFAAQSVSPASSSPGRRLLLVAYHFGPDSATGGFRWNAMARHLVALGWQFDVITRAPAPRSRRDRAVPHTTGPGIDVYPVGQPTWPERLFQTLAAFKRSLVGVPSAQPQRSTGPGSEPDGPTVPQAIVPEPVGLSHRLAANLAAGQTAYRELSWVWRATRMGRRLARHTPYHAVIVSTPPHLAQLVGATLAREFAIP